MAGDQSAAHSITTRDPQFGFAIWFTGVPAAGKTVLAHETRRLLAAEGVHAVVLDSDDLRAVLTPQPRYSAHERDWLYGVVVYLARWLTESGVNVLIAATGNRRAYRDRARDAIPRFWEVHLRCAATVCQARDPKGIYRRAAEHDATSVPGVGAAYEPPLEPDVTVDTEHCPPAACAARVWEHLGPRMLAAGVPPLAHRSSATLPDHPARG